MLDTVSQRSLWRAAVRPLSWSPLPSLSPSLFRYFPSTYCVRGVMLERRGYKSKPLRFPAWLVAMRVTRWGRKAVNLQQTCSWGWVGRRNSFVSPCTHTCVRTQGTPPWFPNPFIRSPNQSKKKKTLECRTEFSKTTLGKALRSRKVSGYKP